MSVAATPSEAKMSKRKKEETQLLPLMFRKSTISLIVSVTRSTEPLKKTTKTTTSRTISRKPLKKSPRKGKLTSKPESQPLSSFCSPNSTISLSTPPRTTQLKEP